MGESSKQPVKALPIKSPQPEEIDDMEQGSDFEDEAIDEEFIDDEHDEMYT